MTGSGFSSEGTGIYPTLFETMQRRAGLPNLSQHRLQVCDEVQRVAMCVGAARALGSREGAGPTSQLTKLSHER